MSMRKIILLNGHPGDASLNRTLAEAYYAAATHAGHEVRYHNLPAMEFDADYGSGGYSNPKPLEPDLEAFAADLEWADHVVLTTPLWWGAIPARLKGVFDRALLPGRAFDTRNPSALGVPAPMLRGKTARVLLTSDTPPMLLRLIYSNAIKKILSRQIFGFVGIKPTRFTSFAPASHPVDSRVREWCEKVSALGARGA
ncbi:MAG: NAD(P)H dehydrogenase [Alphaproteobacteria bacterium MedPE-SWcel]|nr:MAG: NAD(P)H dehydrogenase [Alphaproteobacteria bacterium MedPE-SWcel]